MFNIVLPDFVCFAEPTVITTILAETTAAPTTAATTIPPSTASQPQTNPMLQTQGQNCKQTCQKLLSVVAPK